MAKKITVETNYEIAKEEYELAKKNVEGRIKTLTELHEKLHKDITKAFPFFGKVMADIKFAKAETLANWTASKKYGVSKTSKEILQDLRSEIKEYARRAILAEAKLAYYENIAPVLEEIFCEDTEDEIEQNRPLDGVDPATIWLSKEEYANLSENERNQRALDNYKRSKKTKRQIGRDYERFVGFQYEKLGYTVEYKGIIAGIEDLGRDLICVGENETLVIQCKYWSKNKTIHEKHINQLFGTYMKYVLEQQNGENIMQSKLYGLFDTAKIINCKACFWTKTKLSDTARAFADALKIELHENEEIGSYPMIKCNINRCTGEKIYHLPYDINYDQVIIEKERNEFYAMTVAEAVSKGFRRAYRWHRNLIKN